MIKDKIKVNKTTAIISVIIAGSLLCTGVIASGVLSDRYTKNEAIADEENANAVISIPKRFGKGCLAVACCSRHENDINVSVRVSKQFNVSVLKGVFNFRSVFAIKFYADMVKHIKTPDFVFGYAFQNVSKFGFFVEFFQLLVVQEKVFKLVLCKIADNLVFAILCLFGIVLMYEVLNTSISRP